MKIAVLYASLNKTILTSVFKNVECIFVMNLSELPYTSCHILPAERKVQPSCAMNMVRG